MKQHECVCPTFCMGLRGAEQKETLCILKRRGTTRALIKSWAYTPNHIPYISTYDRGLIPIGQYWTRALRFLVAHPRQNSDLCHLRGEKSNQGHMHCKVKSNLCSIITKYNICTFVQVFKGDKTHHFGGTMAWWLAPLPHCKKVLGSILGLGSLSVKSLHVPLVSK